MDHRLYESPQFKKAIQRVIDQALIVESEFGCPQDIEGGFSLGKSATRRLQIRDSLHGVFQKIYPIEKANILFLTTASGIWDNSITGAAYGFAGGLCGMLIGKVINSIRTYRNNLKFWANFYDKNLEKVLPERKIFFWQTRNIVDKIAN